MIPKTIHYCWLSGEPMPKQALRCMATWKRAMPDYELVHWGMDRFDITSIPFVQEACEAKRWAFAADYIRLYSLYTEGGIYLDCDVVVRKPFDEFLDNGVFTAVEYNHNFIFLDDTLALLNPDGTSKVPHTRKPGIGIQAAVIAAEKGHPFIRSCMDWYEQRHFRLDVWNYYDQMIAPDIYAIVAEDYGFRYADVRQELPGRMLVLPSEYFVTLPLQTTDRSYAIHLCANSWCDEVRPFRQRVTDAARRNTLLRTLFGKKVVRPFAGLE